MRYHVKHKGLKESSDESPVGAQKSTRLVGIEIMKLLRRRLIYYHGNRTCWVLPPDRLKKLEGVQPTANAGGDVYVPLEIASTELDADFSRKDKWHKKRIRALLDA